MLTAIEISVNRKPTVDGGANPTATFFPNLQLVTDFARVATQNFDYQSVQVPFRPGLAEKINRGFQGGAHLQTIWLAAWCGVLYRYTQQEQFQFDVVNYGAGHDDSLVCALDVTVDSLSTGRHLSSWMETALLADVGVSMGGPGAAVAASFLRQGAPLNRLSGAESIGGALPIGRDVDLLCITRDDVTRAHILYNAALFKPEAAERLARHFSVLLDEMIAQRDRLIIDLPLVDEQETQQLLHDLRGAPETYPKVPLHRYIEAHATETPHAIAVTFRDHDVTYDQLNRRANQIAHWLIAQGVGTGIPVAVHIAASVDALTCALGIFKAGGIYVPLDPTYPVQRLALILEDTNPTVIFSQAALPADLLRTGATIFLVDSESDASRSLPVENLALDFSIGNAAFIIYTSGTTGKPKGVLLSYANLIHYLLVARDRYRYTAADVIPAFARFTFSITMFEVLSPLIAGARLIILERDLILNFSKLTQILKQATALHASPSLLRRWMGYMRDNHSDPRDFERLRHISAGGDVVSADLIENLKLTFAGAEVFVIYGSSEISCMGCTYEAPRDRLVTKIFVGRPFKNVSVRLYDSHGQLVPVGVPGEIYFGGAGVAIGYLNAPEITADKFVDIDGERFYKMGDLGRFDADGNLEFLGRNDFQIKLRGMRIELLEIETTVRRMAGVREAVVAEKQLVTGETGLVAYVVLATEIAPSTAEIRRSLQAQLPDYMVPSAFVVMNALPVNFNQKLDRRALPMPTADDIRNLGEYLPPANETQRRLTAIWAALLKLDGIGIKDNFFDSGGNSLLSIDLVLRILTVFGKVLPLSVVLTEPTIERLAQLIDANDSGQTGVIVLRDGGPQPPIFFVHDGEGEILPYRKLAFALPTSRQIYGITPYGRGDFPMLHTRISDVVDHYTRQIVAVQPEGPYTLGGLCIGGFIAYEIARKLRGAGEQVDLVALIDAAHVNAPIKNINARRVASFVAGISPGIDTPRSVPTIFNTVVRKTTNYLTYIVQSRFEWLANQVRVRLFRYCIDHDRPIPAILRRIPVRVLLRFAEKEYVLPEPYGGNVILMRAMQKDPVFDGTPIDDTPYIELFADPLMGWTKQIPNLRVYDLNGGHSSMLQDPNVAAVADAIMSNVGARMQRQL